MHIFDFFNVLHLRARKIIGWKNSQEFQICIQHQFVPLNSFNYRLHSITFLRPFYALFARSIISANIRIAIIWISPSLLWCPCCCETNMCQTCANGGLLEWAVWNCEHSRKEKEKKNLSPANKCWWNAFACDLFLMGLLYHIGKPFMPSNKHTIVALINLC